eukprot:GAHX01000045.1.p1 GENE.GAHX01000045.1~~GAHX01000045.1.p1  ORF type:complete len:224 (+),score=44.45 GAHX01000045.1:48-674(+)
MPNLAQNHEYDYMFKIIIIGNSGVGKTSILNRYSTKKFDVNFISTVGIDFKTRVKTICGKKVKIQLWDTAGQERFQKIAQAYFKGADAFIFVFNVKDKASYDAIDSWMEKVNEKNDSPKSYVKKVIAGNQNDCPPEERIVSVEEGKQLAEKFGVDYYDVSAASGDKIDELFDTLSQQVVEGMMMDNSGNDENNNVLKDTDGGSSSGCC